MFREREEPSQPKVARVERRKDFFTRAIISGLQDMNAEIEKLPESEAKTAALAAVDRYARTLAAAIQRKKREEGDTQKSSPVVSALMQARQAAYGRRE